jgi:hypothetical protein
MVDCIGVPSRVSTDRARAEMRMEEEGRRPIGRRRPNRSIARRRAFFVFSDPTGRQLGCAVAMHAEMLDLKNE